MQSKVRIFTVKIDETEAILAKNKTAINIPQNSCVSHSDY
jgi:hypothetical protein